VITGVTVPLTAPAHHQHQYLSCEVTLHGCKARTSQLLPHQQRLIDKPGAIPSTCSSGVHLAAHVHYAAPWQLLHHHEPQNADSYQDDRQTSANFCRNQVPHRSWILVKIRTALFDADSPSRSVPESVRSPQIGSTNDVTTQLS
jgi:hypothetical protein